MLQFFIVGKFFSKVVTLLQWQNQDNHVGVNVGGECSYLNPNWLNVPTPVLLIGSRPCGFDPTAI